MLCRMVNGTARPQHACPEAASCRRNRAPHVFRPQSSRLRISKQFRTKHPGEKFIRCSIVMGTSLPWPDGPQTHVGQPTRSNDLQAPTYTAKPRQSRRTGTRTMRHGQLTSHSIRGVRHNPARGPDAPAATTCVLVILVGVLQTGQAS